MANIKDLKVALYLAVLRYVDARGQDGWAGVSASAKAVAAIEDAILALNNAAYDRGVAEKESVGAAYNRSRYVVQANEERDEARTVLIRERRAVQWALKERDKARTELADAHTERRNAFALVRIELARGMRLTKALETLADRYHAQMCYRRPRMGHRRQTCSQLPLAVQDAERALAGGESEKMTPPPRPWCSIHETYHSEAAALKAQNKALLAALKRIQLRVETGRLGTWTLDEAMREVARIDVECRIAIATQKVPCD